MKKAFAIIVISILVFFMLSNTEAMLIDAKGVNQVSAKEKILLKSRTIEVEKGQATRTQQTQASSQIINKHVLLQLDHIPGNDEKQGMANDGITLLDYIPDKAWFAYVKNPGAMNNYNVTYFGGILPEDKMSEYLLANSLSGIADINVIFFSDASRNDMINILNKYGEIISGYENRWKISISPDKIRQLASEDAVKWIEYLPAKRQVFNDGSRATESVDAAQLSPYNLNGTNITVAEWDGGWVDNTHADLIGRVILGDNGTCGGGDSGTCGIIQHATHVAGTVLSTGANSSLNSGTANQWRGMAPNSTLISYEWWDSASEMTTEYNASINTYNATISQNSWGLGPSPVTNSSCTSVLGYYDSDTALVDNLTRGSLGRNITILWAAGNDRATSASYCGSIGFTYWTIGPYGTAKNTITVGAVTKAEAMSTYSSWGPTDDGRIKPDVVAAGTNVKSTNNGAGSTYVIISGTSMATPAVSGIVALMQQDYRNYYNATPTPSTVKAILIHTAKDLNETGPDFTTGWGLVNATRAIDKLREDNISDVIIVANVSDSQNKTYVFSNTSISKVTLVWDDYPGTENAASELVNNLDLIVYSPSGSRFFPWTLNANAPHLAAVQNASDSINNVEQVYIAYPERGTWTIIINGTSVPQAPQSFSLVLDNSSNFMPNMTQPAIAPSPAYKHNNLNGSSVANDLNNDNMSVYFKWYKNSVNVYNHTFTVITNGTNVTALLTNGNFSKHDNITLEAFANDTTSNSTFRNSTILQIQNSAPDITLTNPASYANITSRNFTFTYSATDNDTDTITYYVLVNGSLNITTTSTSAEINFSDGAYNWTIISGDNSANATSATRFFTIDTAGPNLTISSPQNRTYNYTALMLNYTISDLSAIDRCWYINATGTRENFSSCYNLSFIALSGQTNSITLYANDTLNNTNSLQVFFSIDTTLPIINLTSPLNQTYNYTPSLNFTVSYDFDKCWYINQAGNRTNATSCANISSVNAAEGFNNITFYANDTAGNLNYSLANFTIDLPPAISISSPENATYATRNISLNYSVSSDFDKCWVINSTGNRINLTSCQNTTILSTEGLNNITLYVNDSFGSMNLTQVFFSVGTVLPSITFQNTANNETLNNTKYILVNVTTSTADTVLLEWNGVNESMINASTAKTSWYKNKTITSTGNYTFRAWVNDSANNTNVSETRWVYVNDTIAPVLSIASPVATSYTSSSIALNFSTDDNIRTDRCWYMLNGANASLPNCANTTITAQAGSNTLTLAINDTANNRNETSVTFTYSTPATTTTTTASSGGPTTTTPQPVTKQINNLSQVTSGIPAIVNISISSVPVSKIILEVNTNVSNIRLTTERLDAKPQGIKNTTGKVFKYMNITANVSSDRIATVKIIFSVEKTWLTVNNFSYSEIFLNRYFNDSWNKLKTSKTNENSTFYEYTAESPGFSIFAISGDKPLANTTFNNTNNTSNNTNIPAANRTINNISSNGTAIPAGNTTGTQCTNATIYAVRDNECVLFNSSCIPDNWTAVGVCPAKKDDTFIYILVVIIIIGIAAAVFYIKTRKDSDTESEMLISLRKRY